MKGTGAAGNETPFQLKHWLPAAQLRSDMPGGVRLPRKRRAHLYKMPLRRPCTMHWRSSERVTRRKPLPLPSSISTS